MNESPYFDTAACVERLLKEQREHGRLIVACDFDDTVYDFHGAGHTYDLVLALLRRCQAQGFWIMLFTGTHSDRWEWQKAWLAERGIEVHSVNSNPFPLPFGNHGKPYYNLLLDDRAGLWQACDTLAALLGHVECSLKESK